MANSRADAVFLICFYNTTKLRKRNKTQHVTIIT